MPIADARADGKRTLLGRAGVRCFIIDAKRAKLMMLARARCCCRYKVMRAIRLAGVYHYRHWSFVMLSYRAPPFPDFLARRLLSPVTTRHLFADDRVDSNTFNSLYCHFTSSASINAPAMPRRRHLLQQSRRAAASSTASAISKAWPRQRRLACCLMSDDI